MPIDPCRMLCGRIRRGVLSLPCPVTEPNPPYNGGALPMAKSTRVYTAQLIPHPPTHNRRHTLTGSHTHKHTHTRDAAGAAVSQVSFLPPAETCFDVVWCPGLVRESGALPSATAKNDGEILILRSGPDSTRPHERVLRAPSLQPPHRPACLTVGALVTALESVSSLRCHSGSLSLEAPSCGGWLHWALMVQVVLACSQRCRLC